MPKLSGNVRTLQLTSKNIFQKVTIIFFVTQRILPWLFATDSRVVLKQMTDIAIRTVTLAEIGKQVICPLALSSNQKSMK